MDDKPKILPETYLRQECQAHDPDRYLISLFARRERQEALWALFLFNYEISKTRFVVTETQLGLIRLQWWREEIAKLYEGQNASDHPVLEGLETAILDYALPKALFDNLLFAREFDLEGVSPQGLEGIINYCDLTTTPLTKLALQIAGDDPTEEGLQELSIRYSLINLFRSVRFYEKSGLILIPKELREEAQNYLINNNKSKPQSLILKAKRSLFYIYLKQLKSVHFDPYDPKIGTPPWFKELRVFISTMML